MGGSVHTPACGPTATPSSPGRFSRVRSFSDGDRAWFIMELVVEPQIPLPLYGHRRHNGCHSLPRTERTQFRPATEHRVEQHKSCRFEHGTTDDRPDHL